MDESIIRHLEQRARITKLSEAIRIGAKLRPQDRSRYGPFWDDKSCALGAAGEALGIPYQRGMLTSHLSDRLIAMGFPVGKFPIVCWNDELGLTREQIADKIEELGY